MEESKPIKLVCVDVDGTLVGSSGSVLPEVWPAVERARAYGMRLALCSGRPGFGSTRELAERLDPDGWHCFQNGASTVHVRTGEARSANLAQDIVPKLIARARELGRVLEVYTDTDYAVDSLDSRARDHAELLGVPFNPRPYEELRGVVVRAQWLVSPDESDAIMAEELPGVHLSRATSPAMPDTHFINITKEGVDKSVSVRVIAAAYAIPLEQVMYVGDSGNDTAAMRIVGWPVAMANAAPETLAVARHRVRHVDVAGVIDALELATS